MPHRQTDNYNSSRKNNIPHKIHFFWTGGIIPSRFCQNILSFIKNLPERDWKVYVWLNNPEDLYQAAYFRDLERSFFPSSIIISNISKLLEDRVICGLENRFFRDNHMFPLARIKEIIRRELSGLGNFAAAKDGIAPLILYTEGGYFFDLDYEAIRPLTPAPEAPHGFLLLNEGRVVSAIAAERGHPICADMLTFLVVNYTILPQTVEEKTGFYTRHPSPCFFELQGLRDRRMGETRAELTIMTSGAIVKQAYEELRDKKCKTEYEKTLFKIESHFSRTNGFLDIGVKPYLAQDGNWRLPKKFYSFDDMEITYQQPGNKSRTQLQIACSQGKLDEVKKLLAFPNTDVNEAPDASGATPFYLACENDHLDIVQTLLERQELEIDKADNKGTSPFYIACKMGHTDIVKLLLKQKNIWSVDRVGLKCYPPLLAASMSSHTHGKPELFQALLANGADITYKDEWKYSALDHAFDAGNSDAVIEILTFAWQQDLLVEAIMSEYTLSQAQDKSEVFAGISQEIYEYVTGKASGAQQAFLKII